jgi:hypothetical protein
MVITAVPPSWRSTFFTFPTSTPAIRTGVRVCTSFAPETTALSSQPPWKGSGPPKITQQPQSTRARAMSPAPKFERRVPDANLTVRPPPRAAGWSP